MKWQKIDIEVTRGFINYKFNVNAPVGYSHITTGSVQKDDYVFNFTFEKMKKPDSKELGFPIETYWYVLRKDGEVQ